MCKRLLLTLSGKLEGAHWISAVELCKKREAEIDSCFEPKVEFYYPSNEYELKKTFNDLENLYREKVEKKTFAIGTKVVVKESILKEII